MYCNYMFKTSTYLCCIIALLCACRPMQGYYETAAPNRESLSFINDSICVHNRRLIGYEHHLSVINDTCYYYVDKEQRIILYKKCDTLDIVPATIHDDINRVNLNFPYDISPQVYNIPKDSFTQRQDFVFPVYYQPMSYPTSYKRPTFYEMYGMEHPITYDTLIAKGTFLIWLRRPVFTVLYPADPKGSRFQSKPNHRKDNRFMYQWLTSTYEYLNYHTNMQTRDSIGSTNLCHTVFSYFIAPSHKEELAFIDDSLCVHSILRKQSSSMIVYARDTFMYNIHNHTITLHNSNMPPQGSLSAISTGRYTITDTLLYCTRKMNGDVLAYNDGILFYSKVYRVQGNGQDNMSLIVKPFIDESIPLPNKTDSINTIMKAYFGVYVPLNFFSGQ